MIVERHWEFKQETVASVWDINNIPEGARGAHVTHVQTTEGRIIQDFDQTVAPYGLQLLFGLDEEAGTAFGTYFIEDDGGDDGQVSTGATTVNVVQNNGYPHIGAYYFTNKTRVTVPATEVRFGFVEVVRGQTYVPILVNPEMVNGNLVFVFEQAESGRIF